MKSETAIYMIIIILTLSTPISMYISMKDSFSLQAEAHNKSAEMLEIAANQIESGEKKIYLESIPNSLRYNASAEREYAKAFEEYDSAANNFFTSSIYAAISQAVLLFWLLWNKRRNITMRLSRDAEKRRTP